MFKPSEYHLMFDTIVGESKQPHREWRKSIEIYSLSILPSRMVYLTHEITKVTWKVSEVSSIFSITQPGWKNHYIIPSRICLPWRLRWQEKIRFKRFKSLGSLLPQKAQRSPRSWSYFNLCSNLIEKQLFFAKRENSVFSIENWDFRFTLKPVPTSWQNILKFPKKKIILHDGNFLYIVVST